MKNTFKLVLILGFIFGTSLTEGVDLTPEQQKYIAQIISDSQESQKNGLGASVVAVTYDSYKREVLDSTLPVLILVSANWCKPCQIFKPIFYNVAESFVGKFKFVNIDFDSFPEFIKEEQIDSIPMLLLCYNGQILEKVPGFMTKDDLVNCLNYVLECIEKLK